MAMLDQLADALAAAGAGQTTDPNGDWYIFKGYMQATPDKAICLYESAGRMPETSFAIDYPSFQVKVRGEPNGYQVARAVMQQTFLALQANEAAIGDNVVVFQAKAGMINMGQDENRRPNLAMNYESMINRDQP